MGNDGSRAVLLSSKSGIKSGTVT